jgi:hypothetical protein
MDKEEYSRESIESQTTTPFLEGKQTYQKRPRVFYISYVCSALNILVLIANIIILFGTQSCKGRSLGTGDADYGKETGIASITATKTAQIP